MARGYGVGSGEAVLLNSSPILGMLLRDQQEKKQQAAYLEKTIHDDMSKLSSDGIRPDDIPGYTKAYEGMQNAGMKYRMLAGSTKSPLEKAAAYQDFQQSQQQLKNFINESKGAKEKYKANVGFYGTNHDKIDANAFMAGMNDQRAPVGTPEYERGRNFDAMSAIFNPKSFEAQKWQTMLNTVKSDNKVEAKELATGQQDVRTTRVIDADALATVAGQGFDSDYGHAKKFFTLQLEQAPAEEIRNLEGYTQKHLDPNFKIESPRDYAIANALYGRVEKDLGHAPKGSAWKAQQAFQRAQQQRGFDHTDANIEKATARKDEGFYLVDDIAKNLRTGNVEQAIAPLKSYAKGGANILYLKGGQGADRDRQNANILRAMKTQGVDGQTRQIKQSDLDAGVLVVAVPVLDKKKKPIKDKYTFMSVKADEAGLPMRINALINYAKGGQPKTLPDKYFKGKTLAQLAPGAFDADVEEEAVTEPNEDDQ